jgi:pimeloyl-ACP methyl ester carboxylesterase
VSAAPAAGALAVEHGKADVNGVRLHYVTAGEGPPLVLVHGFPQTWWEWRHVLPALARRFRVIAVDYRGAGDSGRPHGGYDKRTMALDVRELVQRLCGTSRFSVVGHDMGAFVSYALAAHHPQDVERLVLIDAPIPGTAVWDRLVTSPRLWHVAFHGARDVAEMLVTGRERAYLEQFYDHRAYLNGAIAAEDVDVYARAYRQPGAMRAAFEAYRAIPEDAEVHRGLIAAGRLPMPVLVIGGEASASGPALREMADEIAEDWRHVTVPRAAHWIPEEQPGLLLDALDAFL